MCRDQNKDPTLDPSSAERRFAAVLRVSGTQRGTWWLSRAAHKGRFGPSSENLQGASSSSSEGFQSTVHEWILTLMHVYPRQVMHIHSGHIRTHQTAGKPSRLRCCPVNTRHRDRAWLPGTWSEASQARQHSMLSTGGRERWRLGKGAPPKHDANQSRTRFNPTMTLERGLVCEIQHRNQAHHFLRVDMTGDRAYSQLLSESSVFEENVWYVFGRRNLLSDGCGTRQEQGPAESGVEVSGHVFDHVRARAGAPPSYISCNGQCGLSQHPLRTEVSSRWICRNTALCPSLVMVSGAALDVLAQKGQPCSSPSRTVSNRETPAVTIVCGIGTFVCGQRPGARQL